MDHGITREHYCFVWAVWVILFVRGLFAFGVAVTYKEPFEKKGFEKQKTGLKECKSVTGVQKQGLSR